MSNLSPAELRVLEAIDEAAVVQDLVDLIQIPSVTGSDAESDAQHWHARRLESLGFDVDLWKLDLDELRAHPRVPGRRGRPHRGLRHGRLQGTGGRTRRWCCRGTSTWCRAATSPSGSTATRGAAPSTRAVVLGRGACDMKAGSAANLAVAGAIARSGVRLERPFALHSVVSEEDGGLGAFATMLRGHRGEAAVITEPTSGRIVVAQRRRPDVPPAGRRAGCARQHPARGTQCVRGVPPRLRRADGAGAGAQCRA